MGTGTTLAHFGVPWEQTFGYAQAVRVGDVVYISGQLSHDEHGNIIAPAPLDASGAVSDTSNMERQMRATYANAARVLAELGGTLADVVEEVIYTLDVDATFAVAGAVRRDAYATPQPRCASTLVGTTRLALREQLVEIRFTAVLSPRR